MYFRWSGGMLSYEWLNSGVFLFWYLLHTIENAGG